MTRCNPNSHSLFVPHLNTGQMNSFATLIMRKRSVRNYIITRMDMNTDGFPLSGSSLAIHFLYCSRASLMHGSYPALHKKFFVSPLM